MSILFEVEQDPSDQRVLRITGRASVRTDQKTQRSCNPQVASKYLLTTGGIRNALAHMQQFLWETADVSTLSC